MAHNLDFSNNRANMVALEGTSVWHGLGQRLQAGQSIEAWINAAGLSWTAEKVPAFVPTFQGKSLYVASGAMDQVDNAFFIRRNDTGAILSPSTVTDGYKPHQPIEVFSWFDRYVSVDPRFQMETAGALKGGAIIWGMAQFNGQMTVGGSGHIARLLMTTSFDASQATINKATMVCVVCNNTLDAALADGGKSIVRTRHNTKFDAQRVGAELAAIAKGFDAYKAVGDAMAQVEFSKQEVADFFKDLLGIDRNAKREDISTRKSNQFADLARCYRHSKENESADCPDTVWTALNAVTRYVDHDRSTRGGDSEQEARVLSSQFGSGAAMKGAAMQLLMPRIKDRVLVNA